MFLFLGEFFRAKKQTTLKAKLGALGGGHLRSSEGQRGSCRGGGGVGLWGVVLSYHCDATHLGVLEPSERREEGSALGPACLQESLDTSSHHSELSQPILRPALASFCRS